MGKLDEVRQAASLGADPSRTRPAWTRLRPSAVRPIWRAYAATARPPGLPSTESNATLTSRARSSMRSSRSQC